MSERSRIDATELQTRTPVTILIRSFGNNKDFYQTTQEWLREIEHTIAPAGYIHATTSVHGHPELFTGIVDSQFIKRLTLEGKSLPFQAVTQAFREFGADTEIPILSVSPGAQIAPEHIAAMQLALNEGYYTAGVYTVSMENDGTGVGRLSYNTCQMYSPKAVQLLNNIPPSWEDVPETGNAGYLVLPEGEGPLGGYEEYIYWAHILRNNPDARFCHIVNPYIGQMSVKTGTEVSFDWKLARKLDGYSAEGYSLALAGDTVDFVDPQDRFNITPDEIYAHFDIVS